MKRDPRVRPDGKCANKCGRPVPTQPPKTMPKSLRPMFLTALIREPFCSRTCAQIWHQVHPKETTQQAAARKRKEARDADPVRAAIDREKRAQLFTQNKIGRVILKPEYADRKGIPSIEGTVSGINHSTHGYKHYGCRCDVCRAAMRRSDNRNGRRRRETAA